MHFEVGISGRKGHIQPDSRRPIPDQGEPDFRSIVAIPNITHRVTLVDAPVAIANEPITIADLALEHPVVSPIAIESNFPLNRSTSIGRNHR